MQVTNLTILPALEATTGIPTGISTDFTKPFISQLKINGAIAEHVYFGVLPIYGHLHMRAYPTDFAKVAVYTLLVPHGKAVS